MQRTITLTDRPPVRIEDTEWPVIAQSKWFEGPYDFQANRSGWLKIRQHADGRVIVYGGYDTNWQNENSKRAGFLIPAGREPQDWINAIHNTARIVNASCADDCIANLPPEVL